MRSRYQHARPRERIDTFKAPHNRLAGVRFVVRFDFFRRERWRYRDRPVEVIGMRRTEAGNLAARLRPYGGGTGVRMRNAADLRKRSVQDQVRGEVGGRPQCSLDGVALHIDNHDVRRLHVLIGNAARLDRYKAAFAIDRAGVSECVEDEASAHQFQVGVENFGAELFKHCASLFYAGSAEYLQP